MPLTKPKTRAIKTLAAYSRIKSFLGDLLDNVFSLLDNKLFVPFEVSISGSTITIGASSLAMTQSDGAGGSTNLYTRGAPRVGGLYKTFAASSLNLATGAVTGAMTPAPTAPPTMTAGQEVYLGFEALSDGYVYPRWGTPAAAGNADSSTVGFSGEGLESVIGKVSSTTGGTGWGILDAPSVANFVQLLMGGGAGGQGNANELLESIKNTQADSVFELVTPCIFQTDKLNLVDASPSTGAYSVLDKAYLLSSSGQKMESINLVDDAEFGLQEKDIDEVDVQLFWKSGKVDTAATVEVCRDGVNYQPVTMQRVGTTESYYGNKVFESEGSGTQLYNVAASSNQVIFNATTTQAFAHKMVLAAATVIKSIDVLLQGAPQGSMYAQIIRDDGTGKPSTASSDVVATSLVTSMTGFVGPAYKTFAVAAALKPGTYHIALFTDAAYKASYTGSGGANSADWNLQLAGVGYSQFNGTTWTAQTGGLSCIVWGRPLDIRLRVTASAASKAISAFGVFYNRVVTGMMTGVKRVWGTKFKAVVDNTSSFTLPWLPDPDLLRVYFVEAGTVFVYGAFTLDGRNVVFPANTFNNGGVESDITLRFVQTEGSSFDNSDNNAALLAAAHIASSDGAISKGVNGRGVPLLADDGTYCELAVVRENGVLTPTILTF